MLSNLFRTVSLSYLSLLSVQLQAKGHFSTGLKQIFHLLDILLLCREDGCLMRCSTYHQNTQTGQAGSV